MKIISLYPKKYLQWPPETFPLPWGQDRLSLHQFILQNASDADLPDQDIVFSSNELRWVGGAKDHLMGSSDVDAANQIALKVFNLLKEAAQRPTVGGLGELYQTMISHAATDYICSLTDFVTAGVDRARMQDLMRWLCRAAPDREVVKAAIALLGTLRNPENTDLFRTLGRHEEFTLFANDALENSLDNAERDIWELAKSLNGWGKIDAVERLAKTDDPEIKAWLLRFGCVNTIMNEYLAFTCAVTGNLHTALRSEKADNELLSGAMEIIRALFVGGPAQDMFDYRHGVNVVRLYVGHLDRENVDLTFCASLARIIGFLDDDNYPWRKQPGWTVTARKAIAHRATGILGRQPLAEKIKPHLTSDDHRLFDDAITLAEYLEMDTWEIYFDRQSAGKFSWFFLMQTADGNRIDRVLELARTALDLDAMATGPEMEIASFGPRYATYGALDFIVQDLWRHPRKGWDFIKTSLQSPPIRNRNMALKALKSWGRENWPEEAEAVVATALLREPDQEVRVAMLQLLGIQSIEPGA